MITDFPADRKGMIRLMDDYGESNTMYPGNNEDGERVNISIYHDRIVVATMQDNGWKRVNTYWRDGTREETLSAHFSFSKTRF